MKKQCAILSNYKPNVYETWQLWLETSADPAVGGPGGRLPLGLGSAPEKTVTLSAYNIEFIITIWGRFNAPCRWWLLN